ncbi:hypothetical protein H3S85_11320 [Bartonella sp. M0187]|uniref:hypothetical protein n=1 Tax=Bartonella apihabitans TaxID=2750929 RepID=UPI0018DDD624|nr:hypothetical protein [Bartonella apihabitans]MBI0027045.1 hypothetical protein [Bartonella apihabitans]
MANNNSSNKTAKSNSSSIKKIASPELTGGYGYTFEDATAAVYLTALLCEATAAGLPGRIVTRVALQQGSQGGIVRLTLRFNHDVIISRHDQD